MAGPYLPLPEILPPPPAAGSLLQSVGTIAGEWKSGVAMPQHAWESFEWPDCVPEWAAWADSLDNPQMHLGAMNYGTTIPDKPLMSSDVSPDCETWFFDPFTIYTPISEIEVEPELARRLTAEVKTAHDALFSAAVAKVLWNPEYSNDGGLYYPPFIQNADHNPTFGYGTNLAVLTGTLDPISAYAALTWAYSIAARTTGGAMIHCSPVVLPYFITNGLVQQVGNRYLGPGGTIVVADAGYLVGQTPRDVVNDSFASPLPSAPESWMFVTGPIEIAYDTPRVLAGAEFADARWNRWALAIEQRACFRFDPHKVIGIPVCPPTVPCTEYSSSS